MPLLRVRVTWSGLPIQGGGLSTFYFDESTGTATQAVTAVAAFLGGVDGGISNTASWATEPDVAQMNIGSGKIENIENVSPQTGAGSEAGDRLAPATQGLVRLRTGVIHNGREVRGRLFLPGMVEAHNTNGAPSSTYQTSVNGFAATLISTGAPDWVLWSRTHAIMAPVLSATMWGKWAVLRSRRD